MRIIRNVAFVLLLCASVLKWRVDTAAQFGSCTATRDLGCVPYGPSCAVPSYNPSQLCQEQCCSGVSSSQSIDENCQLNNGCGPDWRVFVSIYCTGSCSGGGGGGGGWCEQFTPCNYDDECCYGQICRGYCVAS